MIQRYNKKINEDGHTSGPSSGASSPAWRSPTSERRRPPDMPVGVNIRNNPFLEREVQKSASACQLSRREQTLTEKRLEAVSQQILEGVLKSHSANDLHPEQRMNASPKQVRKIEDSQETIKYTANSTDTVGLNVEKNFPDLNHSLHFPFTKSLSLLKQTPTTVEANFSKLASEYSKLFERSISTIESTSSAEAEAARISERTARIRAARDRFLSSPVPMRREGTSSASDLRPGDRSSRISCESDVTDSQSPPTETPLGRSASTGMVNVDRESWQRVAEGASSSSGTGRERRGRSRFSLARLAARLRRRDDTPTATAAAAATAGAVSRLCRQSLLVQLKKH